MKITVEFETIDEFLRSPLTQKPSVIPHEVTKTSETPKWIVSGWFMEYFEKVLHANKAYIEKHVKSKNISIEEYRFRLYYAYLRDFKKFCINLGIGERGQSMCSIATYRKNEIREKFLRNYEFSFVETRFVEKSL